MRLRAAPLSSCRANRYRLAHQPGAPPPARESTSRRPAAGRGVGQGADLSANGTTRVEACRNTEGVSRVRARPHVRPHSSTARRSLLGGGGVDFLELASACRRRSASANISAVGWDPGGSFPGGPRSTERPCSRCRPAGGRGKPCLNLLHDPEIHFASNPPQKRYVRRVRSEATSLHGGGEADDLALRTRATKRPSHAQEPSGTCVAVPNGRADGVTICPRRSMARSTRRRRVDPARARQ
jgi:hypothetical protein